MSVWLRGSRKHPGHNWAINLCWGTPLNIFHAKQADKSRQNSWEAQMSVYQAPREPLTCAVTHLYNFTDLRIHFCRLGSLFCLLLFGGLPSRSSVSALRFSHLTHTVQCCKSKRSNWVMWQTDGGSETPGVSAQNQWAGGGYGICSILPNEMWIQWFQRRT